MNYFAENISVLRKQSPFLADAVMKAGDSTVEVVVNKTGDAVGVVERKGKKLPLHSKIAPVKEAQRFIDGIDTSSHDLYIIFGFAFAYHVEELLKRISEGTMVLAIEKNIKVLKAALEARDLRRILGDGRFLLLSDPGEDEIIEALRGKSSAKVSFVTHRGSYQLEGDYYTQMRETCRSALSTREVNIATLAKFERLWSANIMRNILYYMKYPGADIYYDRFKNIPALIIGAGPSLDDSIEDIRRMRDQALLIAVDTAYHLLLKHGIEPHFCVSVDAQIVNARYFEGVGGGSTVLVADPMVHPSVFRLFRGRVVTFGIAFEMMKWIEKICGSHGEITHGGSVSTNACDFAYRLGCSPLFLVGQDLAFTKGRAHVRGSHLDELVHCRTTRLAPVEVFNRRQIRALPPILVKGIGGSQLETNQKMMIFRTWFSRQKRDDLYNISAGGALIDGITVKKADELDLMDIPESPGTLRDRLYDENFSAGATSHEMKERLCQKVASMLKELGGLKPVLSRAVGFAENLEGHFERGEGKGQKVDYILQKLDETDRIIASRKNIKDIISFSSQRTIHTINEGYDLGEGEGDFPEDVLVAKRSRFLYQGLLDALKFNEGILNKLLVLLS